MKLPFDIKALHDEAASLRKRLAAVEQVLSAYAEKSKVVVAAPKKTMTLEAIYSAVSTFEPGEIFDAPAVHRALQRPDLPFQKVRVNICRVIRMLESRQKVEKVERGKYKVLVQNLS